MRWTWHWCGPAVLIVSLLFVGAAAAQVAPSAQAISRMVVTAMPRNASNLPDITRDQVSVYEGKTRDEIADWIPATGQHSGLQLYLLIDDSTSTDLGSNFPDIKKFITEQPTTTQIGIAYMRNGTADIVQKLTSDHQQAAGALRLPLGIAGANSSPYFSVSDLIKKWPDTNDRREIVMITNGVDAYWGSGAQDPYVEQAITAAQTKGVIVYAIYTTGGGFYARGYWRNWWGQMYLSEISDRTGGEAYRIGFSTPPVDFTPFFQQIEQRLSHQYWLAFAPKPQKKAALQPVRVSTDAKNAELVSADRAWVPASRGTQE